MPTSSKVRCPKCGSKQDARGPDAIYYCPRCRAQFDNDPDEGGDYSDDPTRRIERTEARRKR